MKYISTRGVDTVQDFESVVREGLAGDGGLYVPEIWPRFSTADMEAMRHLSYTELALRIMQGFIGASLSPGELAALVQDAYAHFGHPEVTPLKQLDGRIHLLELFHGTTLAFKDVALQFLGRLFGHFIHKRGGTLTVLGATSGDTGSATIEGCRGIPGVRVFILYGHERPSDVQRRQMTCVDAPNVHAIAVRGDFDDCQALVKRAFSNAEMRSTHRLTAANSINWARILAQVVYYFYAGLKAGALQQPVNFVVPTGNYGNAYAGHVAKKLGLPIGRIVVATNHNDSLTRFVNTGIMAPGKVQPSLSPSMDIQLASNAERYLFELLGSDGDATRMAMQTMKQQNGYKIADDIHARVREEFLAVRVSDDDTKATMKKVWDEKRELIDPHTAVGVHAAYACRDQLQGPIISLACAHPAKFPETVEGVTGQVPHLPPHLADLYQRKERFTVIDNDYQQLTDFINAH